MKVPDTDIDVRVEETPEKIDRKKDDQKEDDQKIIVTMRCADMSFPSHGSVKVPCSECGDITWLSVSSRKIKFDKIICEKCFSKNEKNKHEDYCACVTEECLKDAFVTLERHGIKTTKEEMIRRIEKKIGKKLIVEG